MYPVRTLCITQISRYIRILWGHEFSNIYLSEEEHRMRPSYQWFVLCDIKWIDMINVADNEKRLSRKY